MATSTKTTGSLSNQRHQRGHPVPVRGVRGVHLRAPPAAGLGAAAGVVAGCCAGLGEFATPIGRPSDNDALAGSRNGSVTRKRFGYGYIRWPIPEAP